MKKETYFLGIDGGGTKTAMVLANSDGVIIAEVKTGPTNMHTVNEPDAILALKKGLDDLYKKAKLTANLQLSGIGAGFAGIDGKEDHKKAKSSLKKAFGKRCCAPRKLHVVNDTIIGFWTGATSNEGICLIGGTGSNCYGRTANGKEAWAGGMDWKLSDEGSGFEQGWLAFRAAIKSHDGRAPKSLLEQLVLKKYNAKTFRDILPTVYAPEFAKNEFGKLALEVQRAAEKGDKAAREICKHSATELALLVNTVAKKLGYSKKKSFELILIGGVIQRNPITQRLFKKMVRAQHPNAVFIVPEELPVRGALRIAMRP